MAEKDVDPQIETPKSQFSIRAIIVLTIAASVWLWIFRETTLVELAVLTGIALLAGFVAHFVYSLWLTSRVTVMATVLLIYNAILIAMVLLKSSSSNRMSTCIELLSGVVVQPVEMLMSSGTPEEILFFGVIVLGTLFFTPAHSIRPSLPSALITSLGIGIWYAAGILIMSHAGWSTPP